MSSELVNIEAENVHLHCRCCLKKFTGLKFNIDKMSRPLFKLFRYCTGFRIWQKGLYPEGICSECNELLKSLETFCEMCKQSSYFWEELLNGQRISKTVSNESESKVTTLQDTQNQFEPSNEIETQNPVKQDYKLESLHVECISPENIVVKPEVKEDTDLINPQSSDSDVEDFLHITELDETVIKSEDSNTDGFRDDKKETLSKIIQKSTRKRTFNKLCCKQCNKSFPSQYKLRQHIKKAHRTKEENPQTERNFTTNDLEHSLRINGPLEEMENCQIPVEQTEISDHSSTVEKEEMQFENVVVILPKEEGKIIESSDSDLEDSLSLNVLRKLAKTEKSNNSISSKKQKRAASINDNQKIRTQKAETFIDDNFEKPDKPKLNCDKCTRKFKWPFELRRHINEAHGEKPLEIPCKFECGKMFRSQNTLKSHYRIKHQMKKQIYRENAYICEQCGKGFKRLPLLERHRFHHLPPEARPFKCEQCGKTFVMERIYKEHLLRHSDNKKYECPHCDIKKATLGELKEHVNIHTKEKEYACKMCPKIFYRSKTLVQHTRAVHEGIKKHFCRFCQHSFANHINLVHHERIHTGEKPYSCEICDRSFIQPSALKTHMKTHDDTRIKAKVGRKPKINKTKENYDFESIIGDNLQQLNNYNIE